jgi:hypothetical protein
LSRLSSTHVRLLLWALGLFVLTLTLNLRHRTFAWYYHPDEPGKVEQVLTSQWDFHHPMLVLTTTKLAVETLHVSREPQAIVQTGRAVSAVFTAFAIVALSLLAFMWRGWPAAIAAGGALMLHHQLFELSHYMKEDAALLLGFALAWLAAFAFERRPTLRLAAALGAACGVAISGKYIGVIALLPAIHALWKAPGPGRGWCALAFVAVLVPVLLAINWPLVSQLETFRTSLVRETSFVVTGQKGTTNRVPHALYWNVFIDNTTPAIWLLLIFFLAARWRERRALTPVQWHLIAFPFAYALALSLSPKSNDRYFLPATAAFTLLAALGTVDLSRSLQRRFVGWLAAAALILGQAGSWARYNFAFQHDDSRELIAWCRTELPRDAVIAKDSRIWLPDPKKPATLPADAIPQKVLAAKFVADLGTLDELRAQGVTHVAVSESDYGRFFLKSVRPQAGQDADYFRRKAFYETLLREGEQPLFERERGTVIYLHPGIRVYRISEPG